MSAFIKWLCFTLAIRIKMRHNEEINQIEFPISMGEGAPFDWTYRIYHQPLRYYSAKFVGVDDAQDVVENVFLKLWQKKQHIESKEHLQALLYHATRNASLNHVKTSTNAQIRQKIFEEEHSVNEDTYLEEMIRAEVFAEIYRAINKLPSQCGKVISLSYITGLSNKEISEEMGLPEQVVKNYKLRGLKVLKDNLSGSAMITLMAMIRFGG